MNKITIRLSLLLVIGSLLVGCSSQKTTVERPVVETQSMNETLEGILVSQGGVVVLQQTAGTTALDSYSVDLTGYTGRKVSVTGQYSGDTLFVDEIVMSGE